MRQDSRDTNALVNIEIKLARAAHHEAGHLVIAAVQRLRLRAQGIIIDRSGEGLACYFRVPDENDLSRESVVVASLAGFIAEKYFCEEQSYPPPDPQGVFQSLDLKEARNVVGRLSHEYFMNDSVTTVFWKLNNQSERLVEQNWPAIQALAAAVLAKEWEPQKPLPSGCLWSSEATAKCLAGAEIVRILARFEIAAVCAADEAIMPARVP
jgi:hypothetical protein